MDSSAEQADKQLAQLLHAAGRVPLEQLQRALEQIRALRARDSNATLATLLTSSGVIQPAELERLVSASSSQSFIRPVQASDTLVDSLHGSETGGQERWRVGRRIGNYELIELLGRGGMGVVFKARHVGTGQSAAIKGLLIDDEESVERFAREALAQSSVDRHSNVAVVYESGKADGKAFLAMELIEGGDLETRLKERGRLPGAEAARILAGLARGLGHVHDQGILHRDLKPANVLFASDGTPKLVDFGMARLDRAQRLTQTGQILGTPAYMAPEQAMGVEVIDARADVYGLGAILFSALTDTVPFQGQTAMEVLSHVISDDPPQPSSLAPDLDPGLEAICLRAMAKEPGERFQSAREMAEALEAWSPAETGTKVGGRGSPAWLAGALSLGLAIGLVLGVGLGGQQRTENKEAAIEWPAGAPAGLEGSSASSSPTPAQIDALADPVSDAPSPAQPLPRLAPRPPRRIANEALRRGALVMVEIQHPDHPDEQTGQLGWIASRTEDEVPKVKLFVAGGHILGPVRAPQGGFRSDGFGPGARVLIPGEEPEARVAIRRGPMALVERQDHTLTLLGEGRDASAALKDKLRLAPWSEDESLYPSLVIAEGGQASVRILYLESDGAWVESDLLRPLPTRGEAITFAKSEQDVISGRVVGYPGPWVVEIAPDSDRSERILAELLWVYVSKGDQGR